MLKLVLVVTIIAVASAASVGKDIVPIVSQDSEVDYTGKFRFSYESGDGSKVHEEGELKTVDKDHAGEAVKGDFEYPGNDGKIYKVTYTADENGFQPKGEHIPTVPPSIARALAYLATAPPQKDEKSKY